MHYYQFNIGDYLRQTVHLSPMEDICYRRLIDMYYETEMPIPTETDRVSRRLRLDTELVDSVLKEFFFLTEKGWINARCDAEIAAYRLKAETAKVNGIKGGRPKKTQPVSDRNPDETGSKAKHKPLTNKNNTPDKPGEFDPKTYLLEAGVEQSVVNDWLTLRKSKRAAVTLTAIHGIEREAKLARWTLHQALTACCERGWQGFKAEFVANLKPTPQPTATLSIDEIKARKKAEADAAKARMREDEAKYIVPPLRRQA